MKHFPKNLNINQKHSDDLHKKLEDLYTFLCIENKKNNLTRILNEDDYWIKHIYDSLLILEAFPEINKAGNELADLGCGAGFPSLILAAACPDINLTAIDSNNKKINFVERAAKLLELKNIQAIHGRGRELAARKEYQNKFDYITGRAVSDIKTFFREVRRMLKNDGKIILYKTPKTADNEICEFRRKFPKSDFEWKITETFSLPENKGERVFIYSQKIN